MVGTLSRIFSEASGAMAGPQGNPAKRRELEANSKKLGALFVRLNARDVSASVGAKLVQLCAALDNRDYAAALRIQASDDPCSPDVLPSRLVGSCLGLR